MTLTQIRRAGLVALAVVAVVLGVIALVWAADARASASDDQDQRPAVAPMIRVDDMFYLDDLGRASQECATGGVRLLWGSVPEALRPEGATWPAGIWACPADPVPEEVADRYASAVLLPSRVPGVLSEHALLVHDLDRYPLEVLS